MPDQALSPLLGAAALAEALHAQGMSVLTLAGDDGMPGIHVAPPSAPSVGYDLRCQPTPDGWVYLTPSGVGITTVDEAVRIVLGLYGKRPRTPGN